MTHTPYRTSDAQRHIAVFITDHTCVTNTAGAGLPVNVAITSGNYVHAFIERRFWSTCRTQANAGRICRARREAVQTLTTSRYRIASAVRYDVMAFRRRNGVTFVVKSSKSTAIPSTLVDEEATILLDDVMPAVHFNVTVRALTGMVDAFNSRVVVDAGTVCGRGTLDDFFCDDCRAQLSFQVTCNVYSCRSTVG